MREAAIEHRSVSRARRGRAKKRGLLALCAGYAFRLFRSHPGKSLAALGFVALTAGIVGNAVLFQKGRHPAPLFGGVTRQASGPDPVIGSIPVPAPRPLVPHSAVSQSPVQRPDAAPPPLRTAGENDYPPVKIDPGPPRPVKSAPAKAASAPRKDDAITRFLHGDDKASPGPVDAKPPAESRVVAAQRALGKLGYGVKPDGHMGTSTRQALEKFERERHLMADGELSPKLLRELATAAGLPPG